MACFHPIECWQIPGQAKLSFNPADRAIGRPLNVPCGKCIGCRLERSRQWAVRCMHEASMHRDNCFITLTYAPEHLPDNGTLVLKDFQDFMKRLRFKFGPGIRFFHCGEYGGQTGRPHYHAVLFGFDFPDKKLHTIRNGYPVWTSEILSKVWGFGLCEIGTVTFESAAYVARYIVDKLSIGENTPHDIAQRYYDKYVNPLTGQLRKEEYVTMSRRPGIGSLWYDKYASDVYPHDRVIIDGKRLRPPRYYDERLRVDDGWTYDEVKFKRFSDMMKLGIDDNTEDRLKVKERCQELSLKKLIRPYL